MTREAKRGTSTEGAGDTDTAELARTAKLETAVKVHIQWNTLITDGQVVLFFFAVQSKLCLKLTDALLYPGQHYVCVCVCACFHIVLHVSGISGIQITFLKHMLASLSLFVSCLLVLARLRRDPLLPCLRLCSRLY